MPYIYHETDGLITVQSINMFSIFDTVNLNPSPSRHLLLITLKIKENQKGQQKCKKKRLGFDERAGVLSGQSRLSVRVWPLIAMHSARSRTLFAICLLHTYTRKTFKIFLRIFRKNCKRCFRRYSMCVVSFGPWP